MVALLLLGLRAAGSSAEARRRMMLAVHTATKAGAAEEATLTQPSGEQFEAACDHMDNIVSKIAATPAAGTSGLAIKIHLWNTIGFEHLTTRLEASILKDANRFVLDLAPGR